MKLAVMQPYFLPYLGYFQLIHAVDLFVVYDNVKYTKKGWINRNRFLRDGEPKSFSINLAKASDYSLIVEKNISPEFEKNRRKLLAQIEASYRNAPGFEESYPVIEGCFLCDEPNLFRFILLSLETVTAFLEIETRMVVSSSLPIDHRLKNKHKLWAISDHLGVSDYVNPEGGKTLYDKGEFSERGIALSFLEPGLTPYRQYEHAFVSGLSILDVLMFNGKKRTREMLDDFALS